MEKSTLVRLIKEELAMLISEEQKAKENIAEKLESLRKKLLPETVKTESTGAVLSPICEKRVQLETVSKLLEIPVNELLLYFINEVKNSNDRQAISYHLGHVYFNR